MADPLMPVWRLALRNKVRMAPGNRLEAARNIRIRPGQKLKSQVEGYRGDA